MLDGNSSGVTFGTTSDYRLKENVDYSSIGSRLKQLRHVDLIFINSDIQ